MAINLEQLNSVNRCQISEMEKAGRELDPGKHGSCEEFARHVRGVQSAIEHTYQFTAYHAVRQKRPADAAELWMEMSKLCESALGVLKNLKDIYPQCGAPELYDHTLDYKMAADERYYENLQDAECAKISQPVGLFPKSN